MVELDVPSNIWPRFHVYLLKRDPGNPLPSQIFRDSQPPPIINSEGDEVQVIDKILSAEKRRRGRGFRREVLVKWKQFEEPNWELRENLEETEALDIFEKEFGPGDGVGEDVGGRTGITGKRQKFR